MPNIAITPVLMNTIYDCFYRIYLIGTHNEQFLFTGNQNHVAVNHLSQRTFRQKCRGKRIKVSYFSVWLCRILIDRQKLFICIKTEMLIIIIGKIVSIRLVAYDKKLHKTKQCICISITCIIFIINNLLHCPTRTYIRSLQLYLNYRNAIDQ